MTRKSKAQPAFHEKSVPDMPDASKDFGQPRTVIYELFDGTHPKTISADGVEWSFADPEDARYQLKLLTVRGSGEVSDVWITRVAVEPSGGSPTAILHLSGDSAQRLIELMNNLSFISVKGTKAATPANTHEVRVLDVTALTDAYEQDPSELRALIVNDRAASDVIAVAHRRSQVEEFRRLLRDNHYFDDRASKVGGPEAVWQDFIERNPWILGVSLSSQLITPWKKHKLEQTVAGSFVAGPGKRADAVLRTAGRVRSMVLVELKHHRTHLLGREYRHGCWAPSDELAGAIAQSQGTAQYASRQIGERLQEVDEDGADIPGDLTYLFQPRSYVIVGQLDELKSADGGDFGPKVQSFELFRRNLHQPEVVTFDELLARAEWLVGDS